MSYQDVIGPSDIRKTWEAWVGKQNKARTKANIAAFRLDDCKWIVFDSRYNTHPSLTEELNKVFAKEGSIIQRIEQETGNMDSTKSIFDCDDVAFMIRGAVNYAAIKNAEAAHAKRFSTCFGVGVLREEEKRAQSESRPPIEHAFNWVIYRPKPTGPLSLKFVDIQRNPKTKFVKISLKDASLDKGWGSMQLILV